MKRILLIEDNQFKIDKISILLGEHIQSYELTIKKSYNSALNELLENRDYNLVLLDITIPNFETREGTGEYMPLGGKHLLNQLYLNDIASKVIVVTMFKNFDDGSEMNELDAMFTENYPENYIGYVLYQSLDDKWKENLRQLLLKL